MAQRYIDIYDGSVGQCALRVCRVKKVPLDIFRHLIRKRNWNLD